MIIKSEHQKKEEKNHKKYLKDFEEKLNKHPTYTHKELAEFRKRGISGQVCMCNFRVVNTMTLVCIRCGNVLPEYAKKYVKRTNELY